MRKIAWHICALAFWDDQIDDLDRRCVNVEVQELGLAGNSMEKEVKNWATYKESEQVGRSWSRFITFEMEFPE